MAPVSCTVFSARQPVCRARYML